MLSERLVLIAGSSRGIGAAAARLALRYGARVVIHGRIESPALTALAAELGCPFLVFDAGERTRSQTSCDDWPGHKARSTPL